MNIRKHWKRFLLTSTALFWANCGGDSDTPIYVTSDPNNATSADPTINPDDLDGLKNDTLYGVRAVYDADSGTISSSDACADCDIPLSSSNENGESSSSVASPNPYKLAWDTTITCKGERYETGVVYYDTQSPFYHADSSSKLMDKLQNNQTLSLEELNKIEEQLETELTNCAPDYGVPNIIGHETKIRYVCDNDSTYSDDYKVDDDGVIYTKKEYDEKHPQSSSSIESSSSSTEPPPSPLCQKTDFVNANNMYNEFWTKANEMTDSIQAANDSLTAEQKKCLNRVRPPSYNGCRNGNIATKQICDGDTIVNPRYQAFLDTNETSIQKQIDECLKEPE